MNRSEGEILLDAETRAYQVLSATRLEAQRQVDLACDKAAALLLEEQAQAERLLAAQAKTASKSRRSTQVTAAGLIAEQANSLLAREAREAEALLANQKAAAEVLVEAERKAALRRHHEVEHGASEMILRGQREAVAILLQARMELEERRPFDGGQL